MTPDGGTRLFFIVGDPVIQAKAPAGLSSLFAARDVNALCLPIHVEAAGLPAFLAGIDVARNADGVIATVPHKFACHAFCSETSARADLLKAVNVLRRTASGGWFGDMLDGIGMVAALRDQGFDGRGQRALVLGAGGAGSAIALALLEAGVAELAIHDNDHTRRDRLIARLRSVGPDVGAGSPDPQGYDLVVNATPLGMLPDDPLPLDPGKLSPATFVACVIAAAPASAFVIASRSRGCRAVTGVDMYRAQQELICDFLLGGAIASGARP